MQLSSDRAVLRDYRKLSGSQPRRSNVSKIVFSRGQSFLTFAKFLEGLLNSTNELPVGNA